ncbi:MAG: hypothetical protein IKW20_01600 [Bacteroidales bacterium]|nr:hypothetical protein [Bacteroidales bacterium]
MNIRVNLNSTIADGTEVKFRSPADCSQVTGLSIYHTGGKTEFAFADANGNDVGDIDHLFAENAVVKVILDVTAGMAFVQNADTNAYIERTFIKSVNGEKPDADGNVDITIPEGGGGSQKYEETTRLDIRHLIEKGRFLQSSTGLPSYKTAAMTDAGYAMIPVSAGERYRITTYIPVSSAIIFYAGDGSVLSVDEGGLAGGGARIKDYEVTIPEGCTIMGVSTRKRTANPIIVTRVQVKPMTPQDIGEALTEQDRICTESETNDDTRLYSLENGLSFSFKGLDKGKVIFMTDGTRPILSDVYSIFKNHGMVLSVAPVYSGVVTYPEAMNDGSTALEFLHTVEDDGGEIYAHSMNGDAITVDTAEEMLRESKRWLTEEGFKVHGWIAPRGIFCSGARNLYHKYYRYGYGASNKKDSPLNFSRPYLSDLGLEGAKAAIDACESDKTVIVLFHHWSINEIEGFNLDDLEALLSYIESKNVDVTTYRDCFFKYGSYGTAGEAEVDENGVPTGGVKEWKLIKSVTTEELVKQITFSDFEANEIFAKVSVGYDSASSTMANAVIYVTGVAVDGMGTTQSVPNVVMNKDGITENYEICAYSNGAFSIAWSNKGANLGSTVYGTAAKGCGLMDKITEFTFTNGTNSGRLVIGSTVTLYAR